MKSNTLFAVVFLNAVLFAKAAPTITLEPKDQTAIPGQRITLSVSATGVAPVTFQWRREGLPLADRTTSSLVFTNIQAPDAGNYSAVVTDSSGSVTSRVAVVSVVGPAKLDPKLSTNIRLGEDPLSLPASARHEVEPDIARSYTDPNLLLVTFQEGYASNADPLTSSYGVSTNGGWDWTRAYIPGVSLLSGGTYPHSADNIAVIDAQGTLVAGSHSYRYTNTPLGIVVACEFNKSVGDSRTLGAPQTVVSPTIDYIADAMRFTVNTFPRSQLVNRMAMAYSRVGGSSGELWQIYFKYSDDGGSTWSPPRSLSPLDSLFNPILFLPDGSLAVFYWHFVGGMWSNSGRIELALSQDGGQTFAAPGKVQDVQKYQELIAWDGGFHFSACSDRQAGIMYVAYQGWVGPATNRVPTILFTKSIDKGRTWSPPLAVNDTPARRSVFHPSVAASPDGQHVTITFYDKRHDPGTGHLVDFFLAESFDGGDTWKPNLRLTGFSSDLRRAPVRNSLYFLGNYQGLVPALNFDTPGVAVWIDTRNGNADPYAVRINRTQGTTFETWRKLRFSATELSDLAISGESADPENDGVPNLAEYAHALEPSRADAHPLKIERNTSGSDPTLLATYERLAVLSDIQFHWESSTDLLGWSRLTPQEQVGPGPDPSMQRVQATFTAGAQYRFYRLRITHLPSPP